MATWKRCAKLLSLIFVFKCLSKFKDVALTVFAHPPFYSAHNSCCNATSRHSTRARGENGLVTLCFAILDRLQKYEQNVNVGSFKNF